MKRRIIFCYFSSFIINSFFTHQICVIVLTSERIHWNSESLRYCFISIKADFKCPGAFLKSMFIDSNTFDRRQNSNN